MPDRFSTRGKSLLVAAAVLFMACSSSGPKPSASSAPPTVELSGQVLDAVTHLPVAGVKISTSGQSFTTGVDGSFKLRVAKGTVVSVSSCAYSPTTLNATGSSSVELTPLPVQVSVSSNLTHRGVAARVSGDRANGTTSKKGKLSLIGLCEGDGLQIRAKGYEAAKVTVDASRDIKLQLRADPATTFKQGVSWESQQKWKLECALMHPDSKAYTSKAKCVKELSSSAAQGYQEISVKILSVHFINWTFPKCAIGGFGPKHYRHVAAINYDLSEATPAGGIQHFKGIAHSVRTKDGLWRWFPLFGCDYSNP